MFIQATLLLGKETVKENAHLQRHFSISGTQNKWLLTIDKTAPSEGALRKHSSVPVLRRKAVDE